MTASGKMYLKAIYYLSSEGAARPADIAVAVDVSRPSVSRALANLTRMGLAEHQPYGDVRLTPEGRRAVLAAIDAEARLQCVPHTLRPVEG